MGNRGCLHDASGHIVRQWRSSAWISCVLEVGGRRVPLRAERRYTPLFFRDEATALAAGHRPCAQCRREAWRSFKAAIVDVTAARTAKEIDQLLHSQRIERKKLPRIVSPAAFRSLPQGTIGQLGKSFIEQTRSGPTLWEWSGSFAPVELPESAEIELLTPPLIIEVLRRGYAPAQFTPASSPEAPRSAVWQASSPSP